VSTEVRDSLVEVGWLHIGNGGEGVSTLYGFPLRRIDADFTLEQAEQVMQNATMLSDAGQGIPVKAYHRNTRAGSPLTGLPRGEDGDGPVVGMLRAVGIDDERALLRRDSGLIRREVEWFANPSGLTCCNS